MTTKTEVIADILKLFRDRGDSQYGEEAVSQLDHALQTAALAADNGADSPLIAAALMHDIGHLLHDLPDDAPDRGIDDRHEVAGGTWLAQRFGDDVTEPVRLHVPAKRYLCNVDPEYQATLSPPSVLSLKLQGGPMSEHEVAEFERNPQFERAVQLRRWDDEAKIPNHPTPDLEVFAPHLAAAINEATHP
ncbi:MAG: phosphonate degradation HD-domain oxygenase [Planctomycetaceae bacterium]